jgi:eukaryotic-like serine/threonine-protein kinase
MAAANEKEKPKAPLSIGDVVADKYRIESLLGEGGMGLVFEALHIQLGHRVALKVLNSLAVTDREVTERFLREGRALARLQGDHIARVSDVGTVASGEPYLVMEFLEGRDLSRELAARGPLPVVEVVDYIAQACEALAEAHVRGIVHRDLKPANLFLSHKLDGEPIVKVLDFGISKISSTDEGALDSDNITVTSSLVGTPKYMSPEQIQDSRNVDSRTDIWGLGTIFYELLTKTRPFAAPSLALVCVKVLHEEVPAPSTLRPDIPPGIDEIIAKCLKKPVAERYFSVGELIDALVPFGNPDVRASAARVKRILASRGSAAKLGADSSGSLPGLRMPSLPGADSSQPIARTPSAIRITDKADNETLTASTLLEAPAKPSHRAKIAGAAVAGAFVIGLVLFFALRSPSTPTKTTTPVTSAEAHPTATAEPTQKPAQPAVVESATASATTTASAAASAKPKWPPPHGTTHHTTQTTTTAQGTGDVLEDRR